MTHAQMPPWGSQACALMGLPLDQEHPHQSHQPDFLHSRWR